jgi:hypothetical protein
MSIFGNILAKIFPATHPAVAGASQAPAAASAPGAASPAAPSQAPSPAPVRPSGAAAPADTRVPTAIAPVDVEAVVSAMPGASQLNWRTSIVDLMKVLGLDSGLDARKQLAHELGYAGSTADSAAMNVWLHKEVMARLAANGGKVPESLRG